jgi:hypothetical protein
MHATKGLWSALGAGTSLAAAGVLALFSVSVLLGVKGWPQVRAADGGQVAVRAQALTPTAAGANTATAPAVLPAPAARRTHRAGRPGTRTGRRNGQSDAGRGPAVQVSAPQGSSPPAASGSPTSGPGSAPPSTPIPVAVVPHLPSTAVTTVTGAVGGAVAPISPQVAGTVTQTGEQAANAIDQVGSAVGGVVGGLTGAPQP